jgi:predicted permease
MMTLLSVLASDILPIFLIALIGFLLERRYHGSVKTLSAITFNAFSPCLVFNQLVTSRLAGSDVGRMAMYCVLLTFIMGATARLAVIPLRLERQTLSSFLLVVMFSNSGNYALPLILFAFGAEALAFASVYFVTSAILVYTVGVVIAASGDQEVSHALKRILRVPALYAIVAAAVIVIFKIEPPLMLSRPVGLLSDAALPAMLLILGMQIKRAVAPTRPVVVGTAVALSLLVAPVIGIGLTRLLALTGAARSAAIVLASMPAAVVTTVLALEFDLDSSFVTSVVFVSTLLSPLTLVLLIAYLKTS